MINTAPGYQALKLTPMDFRNDMSWGDAWRKFARLWTWIGAHARSDASYGVVRGGGMVEHAINPWRPIIVRKVATVTTFEDVPATCTQCGGPIDENDECRCNDEA